MDLNVKHLRKDELLFELLFRGVKTGDDESVEELRAVLQPLLKIEQKYPSFKLQKTKIDVASELANIGTKMADLEVSIDKWKTGTGKLKAEVIHTRADHLIGRVSRLSASTFTEEQTTTHSTQFMKLLRLKGELDAKPTPMADISTMLHDLIILSGSSSEDDDEPPLDRTNRSHTFTDRPNPTSRSQPVERWNLKFSGDPRKISLHNFLERVGELQVARGVSDSQLFASAIDLFEDKALLWFRANRTRVNDWTSLTDLLRKHYEPPDYRHRLFTDIMSRTQDSSETFADYFACMSAMFRRYGTLAEDVKLSILSHNLAPFYTMQLPVVSSIKELEDECLKLEVKKYRSDHYHPPSKVRKNYVEPDFAFVSAEPSGSSAPVNGVQAVYSAAVTCWNCRKTGHLVGSCPEPRQLLCYRCRKPGFTTRTCPECSAGNANRRT